jgi:hypothetical protein
LLMRFESFLADGCVLDSWICFHLSLGSFIHSGENRYLISAIH